MKKNLLLIVGLLVATVSVVAEGEKRDFRSSWVATVWGIDWPESTSASVQKAELDVILDKAAEANLTAVNFQVRGFSDAMYKSNLGEPWSSVLTGTRGKDPGYDPLQYAIEGAHRRGLELHVWLNPYRVGNYTLLSPRIKEEWIMLEEKSRILDPGNPEVRAYLIEVIEDIMLNYDIDGILFDDYFYKNMPASDYATNETQRTTANNPHNLSLGDWRRENVNLFVKAVMESVKKHKPYVRFGIGPAGVWSTSSHKVYDEDYKTYDNISACPGSWDVYSDLYCDAAAWLKRGYIDYISPQLYWPGLPSSKGYYANSAFDKLCPWWSDLAKKYGRHFFVSQDVAKNVDGEGKITRFNSPEEIEHQMQVAYQTGDVQGHIFYNTQYFMNLRKVNTYFTDAKEGMHTFLAEKWFEHKSLAPAIAWREAPEQTAPEQLGLSGTQLSWKHSADRFSVYAYPKGMNAEAAIENPAYLLGVSYTTSFDVSKVADLSDKTLAVCVYDRYGNEYAPALLNEGEQLPVEEGTVAMKQLWKKTVAEADYLATGNANRSMAYYEGKLYVPNQAAGTFAVVNAVTGSKEATRTVAQSAFWQHNLRITADGQMLLGNSASASNSVMVKASDIAQGGAEDVATLTTTGFGRTDYFYPYGTWSGNGFLLAMSNAGGKFLKVPFSNGVLGQAEIIEHSSLVAGTSSKAIPAGDGYFYATTMDAIPTKHSIATGAKTDAFGAVAPTPIKASGMAAFKIGQREYMAVPTDLFGAFEVYDITHGMGNAERVITATAPLGSTDNATFTIDFCTAVDGYTAHIYVLAPNNGVAAYEFTFTPKLTGICQQPEDVSLTLIPTIDGVEMNFAGTQTIQIYSMSGQLISQTVATDTYSQSLPHNGVYIIRVGQSVKKIVR